VLTHHGALASGLVSLNFPRIGAQSSDAPVLK
jgi:hypothetical protein